MINISLRIVTVAGLVLSMLGGCQPPKETSQALVPQTVAVKNTPYAGARYKVAIGKFENRSPYMNGLFSDNVDRMGMQAQQILSTHVAQSNRFVVVDRYNMAEIKREADYNAVAQKIIGADVILTGAVTEVGRKETGTSGFLGRSRTQTAYTKVTVSVVNTKTSQIVYTVQGAGTFDLTNEHVLGFGSEAGYDATLMDKVLNLAMIEAVNRIVEGLERNEWQLSN